MSGTASRFQTRSSYNPGLTLGAYPARLPSLLPAMDAPPSAPTTQLPAAPQTPAPAPAATPVSAGSRQPDQDGQGANGTGMPGMGANPGTLSGGGLSGFATPSYGTIGGLAGMAAGMATGIPGLGMVGGGIGGYFDAREANGTLSGMGLGGLVDETQAALSGATGGLFGNSAASQFAGAFAPAVPSSLADFSNLDLSGIGGSDFSAPADIAGVGDGYGDGFGDYGNDGDYGEAGGGSDPGGASGGDYGGGQAGESDGMFMSGGYTGQGHPAQPAGTVHKGEVVIPAAMVARYGLSPLMAIAEGSVAPSRLAALARGN